ncbi:tastin isoform X2 [Rhinoderma darwinii]|uniref:tastin isoform X2 n=1 Tax=Rhinoderma darwinii TaxID=43563 RepID=UPI003F674B6B
MNETSGISPPSLKDRYLGGCLSIHVNSAQGVYLEMQSYNEASFGFSCKSSIVQKNTLVEGKENGLNARDQPGKQKPPLEKRVPQDPPKSRLPIPSKTKEPPDFQKLHQSWQNQFQKGKAVKKKSCTRPQPFNFSQKGDRTQVTTDTGLTVNPPESHRRREPLAEVTHGGFDEFKADPAALASILSNVGAPNAAAGKFSLAQRVPMRVSSISQPSNICKNMVVRSSMYAVLRSQSASLNLDRMSCFSKTKVNDPKPVFKKNPVLKSHFPDSSLKELVISNLDDKPQSQENPVLQQMNPTARPQALSMSSPPLGSRDVNSVKSIPLTEDGESSLLAAKKYEMNRSEVDSSAGKRDPIKKAGTTAVEFVADSQALASILSNAGASFGNCGKLSLAQRVPVQSRNVPVKSGMTSSGLVAMQVTTPKPCFGRMSTMAVPLKDIVFSPCRVSKTLMTKDESPGGSAKRVHPLNSSVLKFFQGYSATSKLPFFPKTPRALALEMANKQLEAELSDTQPSARSTVKWADELSPSMSEAPCENEHKIDQVAVRLFLDGECPGETDKKEPIEEFGCLKGFENITTSVQKRMEAALPENSLNHVDVAAPAGMSHDFPICKNMRPPASLSLANTADPPVQYPSIVSCVKTSLPLSFLSHPAVQALQSCTSGPYSLPDIARLRIQAAVSAKQRFRETCLDEECAFYTSRGAVSSYRSCIDPVSSLLQRQEDMHFIPIIPGEP